MQNNSRQKQTIRNPMVLIVHFLLAGIVVLFLALSYGYVFKLGSEWMDFKLPKVFWLSTATIILISILLKSSMMSYDRDKAKQLKWILLFTLILAVLFVYFQFSGWQLLRENGLLLNSSPSVSYVYLLSGLHALHVIAGVILLIVALYRLKINTADKVKELLFFSDPLKRSRLKLLNTYWHTIGFLWMYVFIVFLFHHA